MVSECLPPGVEDAEKADVRSKMFRVERDRQKGLRRGAKQQTIHLALVLQSHRRQWFRQSEHDMKILARQEFRLPLFEPFGSGDRKSTRLNSSHLGISY